MPKTKLFRVVAPALTGLVLGACAREPAHVATQPALRPKPVTSPSAAPSASSVQAAAPRASPPLKSRAADGAIGAAGPVTVEAVAPDGGWVSFCQARGDTDGNGRLEVAVGPHGALSGDELERYFALGSGEGERIDELAAHDPTGRWVVLTKGGRHVLVDTSTRQETDLDALGLDGRNDSLPFRSHRSLSFDGAGLSLLYLRRVDTKSSARVRTLASGAEAEIELGSGEPWRAELDHSGRWAVLQVLLSDTNNDQRLTWPAPVAKAPPACRGPVSSYAAWVGRGDTPTPLLAPASGGKAEPSTGFVLALAQGVVLREPTGRLVLRDGAHVTELEPAKCGARVVHADAERNTLLVACAGAKGRPKLELVAAGYRQELGLDVAYATEDAVPGAPARLVALYPGNETVLVDLEKRVVQKLETGDVVLATHASVALVRRKRSLLFVDAAGGKRALAGEVSTFAEVVANDGAVVVSPLVVDLEKEAALGSVSERPLGVAPDGRVLVATAGDADADHLATGPLAWKSPAASAENQP